MKALATALLGLAALSAVAVVLHLAGRVPPPAELISQDDRALLNPLNMMKQIAAINAWTAPQGREQRIPKRAVLEAQVAAKQHAARDRDVLATQVHAQSRSGRHARVPARAGARAGAKAPADFKVDGYERQAKLLAAKSHEDSETASELSAKAQELAAEAKKQEELSRRADRRGEKVIRKAGEQGRKLKEQADVEDTQAKHLVIYAKKLAQRMVKEEALDEMKKWIASKAALEQAHRRTIRARVQRGRRMSHIRAAHRAVEAGQPHARATIRKGQVPLTALRARAVAKSTLARKPASEGDKIRDEFKQWRTSKLAHYATEHELYTKTQFCNSRATAHSPSIAELQAAFGSDWQDVPPRVASLAAVNGCMEALGLRARDSAPSDVWGKGPLMGKAGEVRACAHGDHKVRAEVEPRPRRSTRGLAGRSSRTCAFAPCLLPARALRLSKLGTPDNAVVHHQACAPCLNLIAFFDPLGQACEAIADSPDALRELKHMIPSPKAGR